MQMTCFFMKKTCFRLTYLKIIGIIKKNCRSQDIAEKIGISRQAYEKWESGATVPDIENANVLQTYMVLL